MSRIDYIRSSLAPFANLFNELYRIPWDMYEPHPPPTVGTELDLALLDDPEYYDADLSGDRRVHRLFFIDNCAYFPGIWIGDADEEHVEHLPIYLFDLIGGPTTMASTHRNLRHFMQCVVDWCRAAAPGYAIRNMDEVNKLQCVVRTLSKVHVDKGAYTIRAAAD